METEVSANKNNIRKYGVA